MFRIANLTELYEAGALAVFQALLGGLSFCLAAVADKIFRRVTCKPF